jgi:hypothetical protein
MDLELFEELIKIFPIKLICNVIWKEYYKENKEDNIIY